ncbi:hypothetical protein EDB82DRAFT_511652, partial [Fusarium venenatum]|uniref:uncharacterized protein n=1 Tax=Fusarium venenatum TaxID=56646 RepID=UPI001D9C76A1
MSNGGYVVLGIALLITKVLPTMRNGDTTLEGNCMHKMAFWNIFDGVNRHSYYGERATKGTRYHQSYRNLLILF